jgi:hypothetical protein
LAVRHLRTDAHSSENDGMITDGIVDSTYVLR